ncbi:alpha-1-inhibitor 3-like isoform X3 [Macrobrachium nipponense]|uniref:alpha-1-inhibitor 3-like isoform X3 n=1 Tax=Macrobrachium nipponense TaxID=159736 RepID=UPI0030C7E6B0
MGRFFDNVLRVLVVLASVSSGVRSHVITTPRKWTVGQEVQVCVFIEDASAASNFIKLVVKDGDAELIPEREIQIPQGKNHLCDKVLVPSLSQREGKLIVTGELGGTAVSYEKDLLFATKTSKTFIQTDKFLYKPSQEVQFRILTLEGPFLKVSTKKYPLIWVETPSGSRIVQWNNVENPSGLIHLSFKLSDEPEEGKYKISVQPQDGASTVSQIFKIEEYVLPRFEVKINNPKYILGTDTEFIFNVCAKYTYGQPVKGNLTLRVNNGGWGSSKVEHVTEKKISGCEDIRISSEDVKLNGPDYSVYSLSATAVVTEDGTGEEFLDNSKIEIERTALKFKSVGKEIFIKPNLPFTGKVKAEWPDGSPASEELMEVCAGSVCKNMSTTSDGILEFLVPNNISESIYIKSVNFPRIQSSTSSWRSIMYESSYRHHLKKYFSPSNSSLVIQAPENSLPCHPDGSREIILPVLFSAKNQPSAVFTVQVISRGQIQYTNTEEYDLVSSDLPIKSDNLISTSESQPDLVRGVINIPISLPSTASPSAKIVVWYSREDGEVISDSQEIKVSRCYTNNVDLNWSKSKVQPGEEANIKISTEPQSTCSLGVVDKSVELLSSENDKLTLEEVFDLVEQSMINEYDNPQTEDFQYCRKKMENRGSSETRGPAGPPGTSSGFVHMPWVLRYYSDYVDALKMFDNSGIYFMTDLTTETRPCEESTGAGYPVFPSHVTPLITTPPMFLTTTTIFSTTTVQPFDPVVPVKPTPVIAKPALDSESQPRTYFPETWLWNIFVSVSSGVIEKELTLPDTITEWVGKAVCVHPVKGLGVSQRAPIITFTPFFTDLTLPPSVKRGEILPVKISVFNYLETDLPVKIILQESSEYEILEDPENELPAGHQSTCIPQQDKKVHTVKIRPLVIGDVNITVGAFVDEEYPEACGPEYVISKRDLLIKPIKVEAEGFPREKTWTKYICSKDIAENVDFLEKWDMEAPSDIVPDSARGWVTSVGDLLGPTLENLGSLVRMPYGCGEQNMLNFAPNIFILQYLDASNQTTKDIANKAIDFMKQGYQRELKYRHQDGSYSAFGSSDESGSTWLTAFVLKSFAQARQYIQIDGDDLDMSRDWLKMKQMENGCFQSVGKVFHKGMKGGIAGAGSPVPLTAYVLISLLESGEPHTSKAISEAAFCLNADKSENPYTIVLTAYALALSQESNANNVVQKMISLATETSNSMHWELPEGSGMSDAVAVETAGYAVLAMMTLDPENYVTQARKVVKWISSKRNGQGGFISTQDTVVALQALAVFEAHQDKGSTNLVVTVDGDGLEHHFFIDDSNKLLQQMVKIPSFPNSIILGMEGEGCALAQAVLRYNVPEPSPSEAFELEVETDTAPDSKCVTKRIKTCASYQHPDLKSNMAVIEVNLVSGYIPEKADLKRIVGYGAGLFKRYEVDGNKVTFYVDEMSKNKICLTFRIIREVDMEDVKPGTVKIYDYYQPEFTVSKSYTLPPNDVCDFGPSVVIDGIIVDEEVEDSTSDVPFDAIDDLLGVLDEMP